jgi:hypothetical protein
MILCALLLGGCVTMQTPDLTAFRAHPPRSIVVVPIMNESLDSAAPAVLTPSLTMPLAERGYYIFPIYLTEMLLRDMGLTEPGLIHQLPPSRFNELFGADAALFVTIKEWSTADTVPSSSVVIRANYKLIDTRTGTTLWQGTQRVARNSGNGGGGILGAVIAAAIHSLATDYKPLALQANGTAFLPPYGLPAGPYHPEFGKDQALFE